MTILAAATAALVVVVYIALGVIVVRRPLLARIAYHQVVRRPGQSALVAAGMMFATAAILAMAALTDTIDAAVDSRAVNRWGRIDLTIDDSGRFFSPSVARRLASDPRVAEAVTGVQPVLKMVGAVGDIDRDAGLANVPIFGLDPASQAGFGDWVLSDGHRFDFARLADGDALLTQQFSERLGARPGDHLRLLLPRQGGASTSLDVRTAGVGCREQCASPEGQIPGLFVTLGRLQRALGSEAINEVWISAPGSGEAEIDAAHRAAPTISAVLARDPDGSGLTLREGKRAELLDNRQKSGQRFGLITISFLVVLAAVAMVVNLSFALAEERRPRLAVLRALGLSRAGMVQMVLIEAGFYSLAGAITGILPGLAYTAYEVLWKPVPPELVASGRPAFTVQPDSLVLALGAGTLITMATVLVAAIRSSKMSVSSAIKDLPEPLMPPRRSWPRIAWILVLAIAGVGGLVGGNGIVREGAGALIVVAATAATRGRLPERTRLTLAGAALVAWPLGLLAVTPAKNDFSQFLGLIMIAVVIVVCGSALLLSANLRLLEAAIGLASARAGSTLRPPLAYLTRRPVRTGLTTAVFGLVLAALAMFAVIVPPLASASASASSGWDVVVTASAEPAFRLPDSLRSDVAEELPLLTAAYVGSTRVVSVNSNSGHEWRIDYRVFYALTDEQLQRMPIPLSGHGRYASDADAWRALAQDPNLMISEFGVPGDEIDLGSPSTPVKLYTAASSNSVVPRSQSWAVVSRRALDAIPSPNLGTTLLVRLKPGADSDGFAKEVRRQLYIEGVDAISTRQLIADATRSGHWWFGFFTDLMQSGLLVGVLTLGVLTIRAVIERRRVIGLLRALGYLPAGVLAALVVEVLLSATIGVAVGLGTGLFIGYVLVSSGIFGANQLGFEIDSPLIVVPVVMIYGAVLLVTIWPALRASRLPASDALRMVD